MESPFFGTRLRSWTTLSDSSRILRIGRAKAWQRKRRLVKQSDDPESLECLGEHIVADGHAAGGSTNSDRSTYLIEPRVSELGGVTTERSDMLKRKLMRARDLNAHR